MVCPSATIFYHFHDTSTFSNSQPTNLDSSTTQDTTSDPHLIPIEHPELASFKELLVRNRLIVKLFVNDDDNQPILWRTELTVKSIIEQMIQFGGIGDFAKDSSNRPINRENMRSVKPMGSKTEARWQMPTANESSCNEPSGGDKCSRQNRGGKEKKG